MPVTARYQALEKQIIIALAHEAKPQQLQQLRRHVEELDFERSGFVLWVVLLSCVRQTAPALSELEVEIPEVAAGGAFLNGFPRVFSRVWRVLDGFWSDGGEAWWTTTSS